MENKCHNYTVENIVRKKRNCLFQAISPFLTMFSTALYLYCVKNAVLCSNGLIDTEGKDQLGHFLPGRDLCTFAGAKAYFYTTVKCTVYSKQLPLFKTNWVLFYII